MSTVSSRTVCSWVPILALIVLPALGVMSLSAQAPAAGLPEPRGPNPVGTVAYRWVDEARQEVFAAAADERRQVVAQIWYPAARRTSRA